MSFPRYPKYKESGVGWLGQVPEHWKSIRYKNIFVEKESVMGSPYPSGSISYGQVVFKDEEFFHEPTKASYQEVRAGEFLINPINLNYDLKSLRTALSGINTRVSPAYIVLKTKTESDLNYLKHQLHVFDLCHMKTLGAGVRQTITFGDIGGCFSVLPPLDEQTAIADFLDRETGVIDALIAEQERMIELLKEKRQAVISHAVTKGLNPDAPMKDSGIEWLGLIPEHWIISKMKWVAKMESGHTPDKKVPEYWDGGNIPWVSLNDTGYLKANDYISETAYQVTEAGIENSSAHLLPPRAVVFSRDATIGRCAITTRPMAVSQHFIAWICGSKIIPEYLLMRLRSMEPELERLTTGATLKTIGMPEVRTLVTPVPPLHEQREIIEGIGDQTVRIDSLTAEAEKAISLLHERRSALISAAVTGQIDVRGIQHQKAA